MKPVFSHLTLLMILLGSPFAWAEEFQGTLAWAQRTELGTTINGIIQTLHVRPGDKVKKGQVLLSLDDREWIARLKHAESASKESFHQKEEADLELERNLELYDRTVLSDHDLQLAKINAAKANAAWQLTQAERTQAKINLELNHIRAPFDAIIIATQKKPGEAITNTFSITPLVIVALAKKMLATTSIDLLRANKLKPGDSIDLQIQDKKLTAPIHYLALEPDKTAAGMNSYRLEVEFDIPSSSPLRAGEKVILFLP